MIKTRTQNLEKSNSIIIEDAIKIYKRGKVDVAALRGLSCNFNPGEISVIMGPSGCGKTTLLNSIGGLSKLTSGKIWVLGENLATLTNEQMDNYRLNRCGFVFQFFNLIPNLTVIENVLLPLELKDKLNGDIRNKAINLLKEVGLEDRMSHYPDELSGGEQQRVAIAAALINDPKIILCDEPTGELDSEAKRTILQILANIMKKNDEKIMIIVTHDIDVKTIADRIYHIRDGTISHIMTSDEIQNGSNRETKFDNVDNMSVFGEMSSEKAKDELRSVIHLLKKKIDTI